MILKIHSICNRAANRRKSPVHAVETVPAYRSDAIRNKKYVQKVIAVVEEGETERTRFMHRLEVIIKSAAKSNAKSSVLVRTSTNPVTSLQFVIKACSKRPIDRCSPADRDASNPYPPYAPIPVTPQNVYTEPSRRSASTASRS